MFLVLQGLIISVVAYVGVYFCEYVWGYVYCILINANTFSAI